MFASIVCLAGAPRGAGGSDLTESIEEMHRANRQRIRTWRGQVKVLDERSESAGIRILTESTAEFAYDRQRRCHWTLQEQTRFENGTLRARRGPELIGTLVKYLSRYNLGPCSLGPARGQQTVIVTDAADSPPEADDYDLDPASLWSIAGEPFDEFVRAHRATAGDADAGTWRVESGGRHAVFESNRPGERLRLVVDLSQAANPMTWDRDGGGRREQWTYQYRLQDGVWLPSRIEIETEHAEPGTTFRRKLEFVHSEINVPLGNEAFSLSALGLDNGDLVTDSRSRTQYVFRGDPAAAASAPHSVTDGPGRIDSLVVLNVAAWMGVLVFFALRRARLARTRKPA